MRQQRCQGRVSCPSKLRHHVNSLDTSVAAWWKRATPKIRNRTERPNHSHPPLIHGEIDVQRLASTCDFINGVEVFPLVDHLAVTQITMLGDEHPAF
jgi:hypothetical protein